MESAVKIFNGMLTLFAVFIGIKQGWAKLSGKPEMPALFEKWNIPKNGVMVPGGLILPVSALALFLQTFLYGNFITVFGILSIIAQELLHKDFKRVAPELPFLIIIYPQYPLSTS